MGSTCPNRPMDRECGRKKFPVNWYWLARLHPLVVRGPGARSRRPGLATLPRRIARGGITASSASCSAARAGRGSSASTSWMKMAAPSGTRSRVRTGSSSVLRPCAPSRRRSGSSWTGPCSSSPTTGPWGVRPFSSLRKRGIVPGSCITGILAWCPWKAAPPCQSLRIFRPCRPMSGRPDGGGLATTGPLGPLSGICGWCPVVASLDKIQEKAPSTPCWAGMRTKMRIRAKAVIPSGRGGKRKMGTSRRARRSSASRIQNPGDERSALSRMAKALKRSWRICRGRPGRILGKTSS